MEARKAGYGPLPGMVNPSFLTQNTGVPVANNLQSYTVGARGPVLLEDTHLIEKIAQFDRERIPERVVHARGASAKGYFEVTHDVTDLSCAEVFRGVGHRTPVIVRFSTVIHERGSPETLRDPRGFAVKFYTNEGNWDLVGNNLPVFFIRDGIKFPDMVHALKPNPKSNLQEGWRILDFFSHHPESCNMLTFLLDDLGIPSDYRHMDGAGVHTYKLLSKAGRETLVRFHWKTKQGVACLDDADAAVVGGKDHSHATRDLYSSIERGEYPEWTLCVQCMDPADEMSFGFDPLDATKEWPEATFPMRPIGRMVLDKNVDNFFAENEQLAFCPANIVPGIGYSDDKLLQSRIFSYADTQRYRLGANYLMLPANAPRCPFSHNHHEGAMNHRVRQGEVNYQPSRIDAPEHAPAFPVSQAVMSGPRVKQSLPKENNFQQPGERFRSWDRARQERFIGRFCEWACDPRTPAAVREIWVGYWTQCDRDLGRRIAERVRGASMMRPVSGM
ncbi:unnamed protein product [Pedinophyceae sp. YPF-701]|nr:unnamed protein product [Pedinophyceae sp. YPF-701]